MGYHIVRQNYLNDTPINSQQKFGALMLELSIVDQSTYQACMFRTEIFYVKWALEV